MKRQALVGNRLGRLAAIVGTVALVGAAACAGKVDQDGKQDEVTVKQIETERYRHHKSPVSVVIEAARQYGDLTVEQEETVDTIAAELEGDRDRRRALGEKLRTSAVSVVRSGTADSEEFEQAVAEAVRAVEEHIQQSSDALEEIHGILEPEQRTAVAAALHDYIDEKLGPRPDRVKRHRDGFGRFASHLMLSSLQVDKLMAIKKELVGDKRELRPTAEELHAIVDAFEGDEFRAAVNAFHAKKLNILRARVARAGERTDTVLAIFTPEQRDLLADLILEGPSKVLLGEENAPQD